MITQRLASISAWLLFGAALAFSQEFRGRIQGQIHDSSGAPAPSAAVTLKNTATGVEAVRSTNEQGRYVFDYVDPGTYTLSTDLKGFKKFNQHNVLVQQRGDVTVDVTLEIGLVSESVTVETQPVALELNTSSRDLTIETKMVRSAPVAVSDFEKSPWRS